jgi:hypothetical protein
MNGTQRWQLEIVRHAVDTDQRLLGPVMMKPDPGLSAYARFSGVDALLPC